MKKLGLVLVWLLTFYFPLISQTLLEDARTLQQLLAQSGGEDSRISFEILPSLPQKKLYEVRS